MSAPMRLTADQLRRIASALEGLSRLRRETGVSLGAWGGDSAIMHEEADVALLLAWDHDALEYVIDDRNGS